MPTHSKKRNPLIKQQKHQNHKTPNLAKNDKICHCQPRAFIKVKRKKLNKINALPCLQKL